MLEYPLLHHDVYLVGIPCSEVGEDPVGLDLFYDAGGVLGKGEDEVVVGGGVEDGGDEEVVLVLGEESADAD